MDQLHCDLDRKQRLHKMQNYLRILYTQKQR